MRGFIIKALELRGQSIIPAQVQFKSGLNVISGPSNTGKTFIFQCINYMLGSSKAPKKIKESLNYSRILLEIETSAGKIYTLESDLKGGDFKLFEKPISEIDHTVSPVKNLARKHDSENEDNLSAFLLKLNNLWGKKIRTNAKGKTRKISYRDVCKLLLIDETRIMTDRSPITSGQFIQETEEESLFRFLVSGIDDSDVIEALSPKQITHRKGKIELLGDLIENSEKELTQFDLSENTESHLVRVEKGIDDLILEHSKLKIAFNSLDNERKEFNNELVKIKSNHHYLSELLLRSSILHQQYSSDLARLKSTIEASLLLVGNHTEESECPVCKTILTSKCDEDNINQVISSCKIEIIKISALEEERKKSEILLIEEKEVMLVEIQKKETSIVEITQKLNEDIGEKLTEILKKIEELNKLKAMLIKISELLNRIKSFQNQKEIISRSIPKQHIDNSNYSLSTSLVHPLTVVVKSILEECNYPDLSTVSFSEDKKDLVISGQDRELAGKGYRAITYSSFILALQNIMNNHSYTLGVPVLDSPLVTYKKPNAGGEGITVDLAMDFYRFAAKNDKIPQLIILENEIPPQDIIDSIHHIVFTQSKEVGRYGFIPNQN